MNQIRLMIKKDEHPQPYRKRAEDKPILYFDTYKHKIMRENNCRLDKGSHL